MPYKVISTQSLGNATSVVTFWDGTAKTERQYPAGYSAGGAVFPPPVGMDFATLPEVAQGIPIGASIWKLEQTVAAGGKVERQDWYLNTGDRVTATYEYGPNSNTIPIKVQRAINRPGIVLSNFRLNAAGTQILYDQQNGYIGETTGHLFVTKNGVTTEHAVTHYASGIMNVATAGITLDAKLRLSAYVYPTSSYPIVNQFVKNLSTLV